MSSCFIDRGPCMCEDHWDFSHYLDSCADQEGCTDCDESGRTWCQSANTECDKVERDSDGNSQGWFWCAADPVSPKAGNIFK